MCIHFLLQKQVFNEKHIIKPSDKNLNRVNFMIFSNDALKLWFASSLHQNKNARNKDAKEDHGQTHIYLSTSCLCIPSIPRFPNVFIVEDNLQREEP
jgi:hypothetical protein